MSLFCHNFHSMSDHIVLRGPAHPPHPWDPPGSKERVTGYGFNKEGKKIKSYHWNTDGTVDKKDVPVEKQ